MARYTSWNRSKEISSNMYCNAMWKMSMKIFMVTTYLPKMRIIKLALAIGIVPSNQLHQNYHVWQKSDLCLFLNCHIIDKKKFKRIVKWSIGVWVNKKYWFWDLNIKCSNIHNRLYLKRNMSFFYIAACKCKPWFRILRKKVGSPTNSDPGGSLILKM